MVKHVAAAQQQFALLACGQIATLGVDDAGEHAGQWRAHGAGDARRGVWIAEIHAGLGHAIAFEDALAGKPLKFIVDFGGQGRAA